MRFSPSPFTPKLGDSHIASGPSGGKFLPWVHPFGGTKERGTIDADSKTADSNTAMIKNRPPISKVRSYFGCAARFNLGA
jgi:hypothetical protein